MSGSTASPRSDVCVLTVDVEDWFQSYSGGRGALSDRVVRNTHSALDMLDAHGVKATFFVVAEVARRFGSLIRELGRRGHDVQCHGERHISLHSFTPRLARASFERARKLLEDVSGARVSAFRAPYFSIDRRNFALLDCLVDAGFEIDSSIFPMRMRRYGVHGWPLAPHYLDLTGGARLLEVPLAVADSRWGRWPVAGGGYLRLLPQRVVCAAIDGIIAAGRPAVLYCHSYEFNPNELADYSDRVPWYDRMHQGLGRRALVETLASLFSSQRFLRLDELAKGYGWMSHNCHVPRKHAS